MMSHKDTIRRQKTEKFIKEHIKKHGGRETDAYGEIEFPGSSSLRAKYVRAADDTVVGDLYTLLTKHWGLAVPNLVISITGSAKNFTLRPRLMETFRKSLIKVSESTGAWITTGGTHAGVMKHVGKAVKNYAAIKDDEDNKVVTIGIASWGVIHKRDELLVKEGFLRKYDAEEAGQGINVILNSNHSHFILVDSDCTGKEAYGKEIELRNRLERHIASRKTNDDVEVMIVCVIVQGGPGSLETAAGSISNDTPVVIVGGSGGWADVLAAASSMHHKPVEQDTVARLMKEFNVENDVGEKGKTNVKKWTKMVNECLEKPKLITIFSLDASDMSRDLDMAILKALLNARSEHQPESADEDEEVKKKRQKKRAKGTKKQLELAMLWNRSDIAKSLILNDDSSIKQKDIADIFFKTLKTNKHEFCEVLLDYGIDLKKYCTVKKMERLYKANEHYKDLERKSLLEKVAKEMDKYLGRSYNTIYTKTQKQSGKYSAIVSTDGEEDKLEDPYREIFQWAILMNYREIARHIWNYMSESMSAAIMATKMLRTLSEEMTRDSEEHCRILAAAEEYEKLAAGIIDKCFLKNRDQAIKLLIAKLPKWGGYTCLEIAVEANAKHFTSRRGVRIFFENLWMGKLALDTRTPCIILSGICPPLIWRLRLRHEENKSHHIKKEYQLVDKQGAADIEMSPLRRTESRQEEQHSKTLLDRFRKTKLGMFYNTPVVKFWMNVLAYLVYLCYFSFIIMSNFDIDSVSVTAYEYVLVGWMTTFLFEEIREVHQKERESTWDKIELHIEDRWNIMDIASMTFFYAGFGMRFFSSLLDISLILYSFAFMIQCVRIIHIFAVHRILGPKLIMVGKMLKDLLFFIFILIVFLLAYGVASQALLYPGETRFSEIIVGILYRPYWQIYGELFLDEINYNPNVTDYTCSDTDANLPRCPKQSVIVPIISAFYLLLANVLLLNLLIAMFSYTFENVQQKSAEIGMFERQRLIVNYHLRPALVPPLIIFSHIFYIISSRERLRPLKDLKKNLKPYEFKVLRKWERRCADEFMREKHSESEMKVDTQFEKLSNDLDGQFEKLNSRIDSIMSATENLQCQLKKLEGKLE